MPCDLPESCLLFGGEQSGSFHGKRMTTVSCELWTFLSCLLFNTVRIKGDRKTVTTVTAGSTDLQWWLHPIPMLPGISSHPPPRSIRWGRKCLYSHTEVSSTIATTGATDDHSPQNATEWQTKKCSQIRKANFKKYLFCSMWVILITYLHLFPGSCDYSNLTEKKAEDYNRKMNSLQI